MPKTQEEKAAAKLEKLRAKAIELNIEFKEESTIEELVELIKAAQPEDEEETQEAFKLSIYLDGHKQPYIKEFATAAELERAREELKKNKNVVRVE